MNTATLTLQQIVDKTAESICKQRIERERSGDPMLPLISAREVADVIAQIYSEDVYEVWGMIDKRSEKIRPNVLKKMKAKK
jgi:Mg/Co/Ni transporter MgtE